MPPAPSLVAAAVSDGLAMYCPGVFIRGGSTYDYSQPPTTNSPPVDHGGYPPVGVVVGAGAAGALAGELSRARAQLALDCQLCVISRYRVVDLVPCDREVLCVAIGKLE